MKVQKDSAMADLRLLTTKQHQTNPHLDEKTQIQPRVSEQFLKPQCRTISDLELRNMSQFQWSGRFVLTLLVIPLGVACGYPFWFPFANINSVAAPPTPTCIFFWCLRRQSPGSDILSLRNLRRPRVQVLVSYLHVSYLHCGGTVC